MKLLHDVFGNIVRAYSNASVSTSLILSVLLMVTLISVYEFIVYRFVSHRSFYNKSFNISVSILPFFISTIILCLQSNMVITLGTIGALAIIRYRTAVKDPVDMIYLLWSVHTGIVCGCQLYEIGVITSLIVTVLLIVLEHLNIGSKPYILVVHAQDDIENDLKPQLEKHTRSFRIKNRNYSENGFDYAIEFAAKDPASLSGALRELSCISRFSVVQYDSNDIL